MIDETLQPYRWLRRIALASTSMLLALLVARLIVGAIIERRWEKAAASFRDAKIALRISELQHPPIDDADNAAAPYLQAITASGKIVSPRGSNYVERDLGVAPDHTPLWHELADEAEHEGANAFAFVRSARSRSAVDWGVQFKSPSMAILLPYLNGLRGLANILADSAERAFIAGDFALGLSRIDDLLKLSKTGADRPFLVTALVADGIDAMTVDTLAPYVSTIAVGTGPREVSPEVMRALIRRLVEEGGPTAYLADGLRNEVTGILDPGAELRDVSWIGRPAVVADMIRVSTPRAALARAAGLSSNAALYREDAAQPTPTMYARGATAALMGRAITTGPVAVARPLTHTVMAASLGRAVATTAGVAASRDGLAIMLALRLYEVEHTGEWPASLEELVPNYLPHIPRNKVSADDTPYLYQRFPAGLPDGRDRPILIKNGALLAKPPAVVIGASRGPTIDLSSLARPPASTPQP